ncbi:hypothetical protein [Faecalicatena orotica]|nr:hypothetical protein [Faecalicatena orotica]
MTRLFTNTSPSFTPNAGRRSLQAGRKQVGCDGMVHVNVLSD